MHPSRGLDVKLKLRTIAEEHLSRVRDGWVIFYMVF
jgi:hypothetical protein